MKLILKAFFIILVLFCHHHTIAQEYYRMSADFTTKTKPAEGKANLTKGRIYYDKYTKELIYDITFPQKEKWVIQDSKIYKLQNDSIYLTDAIPSMNEFTVFHLSLNSSLNYFGLKEAKFTIAKVDKKDGLVISYWNIPPNMKAMISSIAIAKKDNSLYSVVIVGPEEKILSKQFFRDYIRTGGFEFPGKIIQIYYDENNQENYQVMEFKNIVLNDTDNEEDYHYRFDQ